MASGSGWNLWVWLAGVGYSCKEVYRFPHIPTPLVYGIFCSSIPTFCSFKKMFFVLVLVHFGN